MSLSIATLLALIAIVTATGETDPLQITGHPQNQKCPVVKPCPAQDKLCPDQDKTTCPGQDKRCSVCCVTAVFQCTAEGTSPLTFTWWRRWLADDSEVIEKVESNNTCFIQMVNKSTSQLSFSNTSMPAFEQYFCEVSNANGQSNKSKPALLFVYEEGMGVIGKGLLVAAIVGGAVAVPYYAAPALLGYLGFTSVGVTACSWAAAWQAKLGIGYVFAAFQSAGMAGGFSIPGNVLLGLAGGAAGGAAENGVAELIAWLQGQDHCGLNK